MSSKKEDNVLQLAESDLEFSRFENKIVDTPYVAIVIEVGTYSPIKKSNGKSPVKGRKKKVKSTVVVPKRKEKAKKSNANISN
ncbi:hypothetical protein DPMN_118013 [Dreissena polymorpha]|uniref:Uncharacterized protein n=1 Tax=Dreissena polymorpha TaxID=45954 RepID=A0A9D4GMC4_DREPO|nr:hypothetical protein DPMN_118013 [Dreissena polymorpha]